jgi:hypothetical protein
MLQRTSRLRDALERQGGFTASDSYCARDPVLAIVAEAELATPSDIFPSEFRWEALKSCYKIYTHHASGKTTVDQKGTSVDVLWLSPTVFISPLHIRVGEYREVDSGFRRMSYDCEIKFIQREEENAKNVFLFRVYRLWSLAGGDVEEPSLVPFQFLQHATALLPVNYFGSIVLSRVGSFAQRCPSDHLLQFLDVVPNGSATEEGCYTNVVLVGGFSITRDELQAILSHPFHPNVHLGFDSFPFRDKIPMIEMLKETRSLRSVDIPFQVIYSVERSPVFALSAQLSNLMMHASARISPSQLGAIATIHNVYDISIKSYVRERVQSMCFSFF